MGKKGPGKKGHVAASGPQMSVTIREASTGKKHTNAKSALKLEHIKNLAAWASRDAAIPSLGAFFGHHLAASSEVFGAPADPSLFTCERCESMLHPGYNCTIRIEKNKKNARRKGKKTTTHPRNNIVYTCHFCSHRNMKRGTPRNTSQPKVKPQQTPKGKMGIVEINQTPKVKMGIVEINQTPKVKDDSVDWGKMRILEITDTMEVKDGSDAAGPATPLTRPTLTLLESKMKKRNRSGTKKKVAPESTPIAEKSSNKRRRKSWTSLKEIAESNENEKRRKLMSLTIPFSMQ